MAEPEVLDIAPIEVTSPVAPPAEPAGAPVDPRHVLAAALSNIPEAQALRVADELVVALAAAGWWFVHDSEPGKRTGYRAEQR